MSTQVQRRKGTTVQHSTFTGASAELTVDTTKNTVVVHDGATAGGIPLAKETGSAISATTLGVTGVSTLTGGAVVQGLTVGRGAGAGDTNTAVGASALAANTTGQQNTGVGYQALILGTGDGNAAFGSSALAANTTASDNTAIGARALFVNTTGGQNTAVGRLALNANITASNNTAVGYLAGVVSTGIGNQFFGYSSGSAVTTGAKNVIIGSYTGSAAPISVTGSNFIVLSDGDGNVRGTFDSSGNLGIGTSSPAYKLDVAGSLLGRGETNALGNTAVSATTVLRVGRGASGTENISAGAAGLDGILGYPTFKSTADGQNQRGVSGNVYSIADGTARVISSQSSLYAYAGGKGANVTITNAYGLYVEAPTAGATNTGIYNAGTLINAGNVGIGTTSPSASAILDAQSTTKGVRMPNMTTTQKNAIATPAAGLIVFDTTLAKLCVYTGAAWQTITSI